jgi:hypothetical protein
MVGVIFTVGFIVLQPSATIGCGMESCPKQLVGKVLIVMSAGAVIVGLSLSFTVIV